MAPPALKAAFDWKWIVIGVSVAFTVYLAVVPLGFLLWESFRTPQTATREAVFTLGNYTAAYGSSDTWRLFWNSIEFAFGASLFAFVLGTTLAWMNERTNTPFKSVFFALSIIPLVIPGILFVVAWILLASPKIGILNLVMQSWFGFEEPLVDIYSLGGMIWVDGLHYSPMAFLLMTAAFRAMDPSLEESATMSGANIFQVVWRVTLRLAWPAIFATILILFVRAIESFEVPALLGLPVGIQVFTSSIYQAVHRYPSQMGLASAYSVTLLAITTAGVYFVSRLSSRGSKYATVTGKGFRPRQIDLGRWRWFTAAIFVVYFLLIVVLPFSVLSLRRPGIRGPPRSRCRLLKGRSTWCSAMKRSIVSIIAAGIGTVAIRSLPASVNASPSEGSAVTIRMSNVEREELASLGRRTTQRAGVPDERLSR